MNISMYSSFNSSIAQQEAQINTLEQQIASGVSVQTPDQNPAAYETATLSNNKINAISSEATTQASIQSQLGSVNNAYQSVSAVFNNVQSIIEQAINGTTNSTNMQSLATQVTSASQALMALGNSTGGNGTFLFGGSRGTIAPFQTGQNNNIVYMGDGGQSQASITPDNSASTIANGDVFMSGLTGNGYTTTAASTTNTGNSLLVSEGVVNPSAATAFQSGSSPITVNFAASASGLSYSTTQGGVSSPSTAVTAGMTMQLGGVSYQLSGTPNAGDSFTVSPSRPQSAFSLLQNLANTLSSSGSTPSQQALSRQQLNGDLASLAQYQQSVVTAQAQNGVTLQAVSAAATSNSSQSTALQSSVQNAVGVNMPAAITSLNETLTAVQAAMKAYGTVQSLSLFTYI